MLDSGRAPPLRVVVLYVYPNLNLKVYNPLAQRFVRSYMEHPPGEAPHELHVIVNNGPASEQQQRLFFPIATRFHAHNNYAKDIGAYMSVAITLKNCDLLVCLGSHVYCHRAGWLDRMVEVYLQHGPGLYGCWGFMNPAPHIRTTAFWIHPEILTTYPHRVDGAYRYGFEHGKTSSILCWTRECGFPVIMASWTHEHCYPTFRHLSPSQSLVFDRFTNKAGAMLNL